MSHRVQRLWCCGCGVEKEPRLTNGAEIYPRRPDLESLPFWKCDDCGNYVGCHHKTKHRTLPLGNIPTPAIRKARMKLHDILDPLWREGHMSRGEVYKRMTERMGYTEGHCFHVGETTSLEEIDKAINHALELFKETSNACQT